MSLLSRSRVSLRAVVALCVMMLAPRAGSAALNCPGTLGANYTASQDIAQTANTSTPCISAGVYTLNMNGHSILCQSSSGCQTAVQTYSGTVKNGTIASNGGDWQTGINVDSATITNMTIQNADTGILFGLGVNQPAPTVQKCSLENITGSCMVTASGKTLWEASVITQTFCTSSGDGISVDAGTYTLTKPAADINNNYISAAGAGISATGTNVTIEQNIVPTGSPLISSSGTLTKNICPDAGVCPPPSSNFSLSVNFTP